MQTYRFKTSLKCDGCIAAIKPGIETIDGIENWNVQLGNPESELIVEGKEGLEHAITGAVQSAGYRINLIN